MELTRTANSDRYNKVGVSSEEKEHFPNRFSQRWNWLVEEADYPMEPVKWMSCRRLRTGFGVVWSSFRLKDWDCRDEVNSSSPSMFLAHGGLSRLMVMLNHSFVAPVDACHCSTVNLPGTMRLNVTGCWVLGFDKLIFSSCGKSKLKMEKTQCCSRLTHQEEKCQWIDTLLRISHKMPNYFFYRKKILHYCQECVLEVSHWLESAHV